MKHHFVAMLLSVLIVAAGDLSRARAGETSGNATVVEDGIAADVSLTTGIFEDAAEAYRVDFGHYPGGSSSQIERQLFGFNPKRKIYVYLDANMMFNKDGDLLDPWWKPYVFLDKNARFSMRSIQYDKSSPQVKKLGDINKYRPIPQVSNEMLVTSQCYKLAIAIKLFAEQKKQFPTMNGLEESLFIAPGRTMAIISSADSKRALIDPWGSKLKIDIKGNNISVKSAHSNYTARETADL